MAKTYTETKTHEVTVDVVILTIVKNTLKVLLVKKGERTIQGKMGYPRRFY